MNFMAWLDYRRDTLIRRDTLSFNLRGSKKYQKRQSHDCIIQIAKLTSVRYKCITPDKITYLVVTNM